MVPRRGASPCGRPPPWRRRRKNALTHDRVPLYAISTVGQPVPTRRRKARRAGRRGRPRHRRWRPASHHLRPTRRRRHGGGGRAPRPAARAGRRAALLPAAGGILGGLSRGVSGRVRRVPGFAGTDGRRVAGGRPPDLGKGGRRRAARTGVARRSNPPCPAVVRFRRGPVPRRGDDRRPPRDRRSAGRAAGCCCKRPGPPVGRRSSSATPPRSTPSPAGASRPWASATPTASWVWCRCVIRTAWNTGCSRCCWPGVASICSTAFNSTPCALRVGRGGRHRVAGGAVGV